MTIDFITIDIVLVDEQAFVWVFTKLPFSGVAIQTSRFRCLEIIDV